jgi:EmrB/QacA subfamily drug resistance transporter
MTDREAAPANPRRWWTLVAMTGSLSMIMLDSTVVGVSLPTIQADVGLGAEGRGWVVNGYLLAMASCLALGGRIGDVIGRPSAFIVGMIGFMLASIGCGVAQEAWQLVAGRIAQGVFAAIMQPASAAIVTDSFAPGERGKAMAVYGGISLLFLAAGPVIGGVIVEIASWRWVFWLNLPIAAASLALSARVGIRSVKRARRPLDLLSVALILVGMPLLVGGLQSIASRGWNAPAPWAIAGGGALLMGVFARRQWRLSAHGRALIDLPMLRDRGLLGDCLTMFFIQFATIGQTIFLSIYLQDAMGFDPLEAGVATLPLLIPVLIVIHVAGRMYDRVGVRTPVLIGLSLAVAGVAVEVAGIALGTYPVIATGMVLLGAGLGFAMTPTNTDALSRVDPARRGEASGILNSFRQVGSSLGLAFMVVIVGILTQATFSSLVEERNLSSHQERSSELVARALDGDLAAAEELASRAPEIAQATAHARRRGMVTGFAAQCASMGLALAVAVSLVRPPKQGHGVPATPTT